MSGKKNWVANYQFTGIGVLSGSKLVYWMAPKALAFIAGVFFILEIQILFLHSYSQSFHTTTAGAKFAPMATAKKSAPKKSAPPKKEVKKTIPPKDDGVLHGYCGGGSFIAITPAQHAAKLKADRELEDQARKAMKEIITQDN